MRYFFFTAILLICSAATFAQPPGPRYRVSGVPRGTPMSFTNIPADAPSRKFPITSETPVRVRMGTEYYEDDRLVREKTDLTGTLTGTITPELVFKKNSGGRWEVLQFYQPEVISSMPFPEKENCLSKGIFGDGVNPGKGIKVPIALLYCEEDGKDGIASHFGTVDGVAPSGDLYRKIETLPEKLGKYTILYYILENVEK